MSDFYLHSVGTTGDIKDIDGSLIDLERILSTGAILTRRARGLVGFGFNGTKHISLSDYDKRFNNKYSNNLRLYDYTAYQMYATKSLSIMIDKKKVKAIIPTLVEPLEYSFFSFFKMFASAYDLVSERMSDLPDEVQVKGNIYENCFRGITVPVNEINDKINYAKLIRIYEKIKEIIKMYEYNLKIYDVQSMDELSSTRDIEEIIKRSR